MIEVKQLTNEEKPKIETSKITVSIPEYYYEQMSNVSAKYGGIQGFMTYAVRRYLAKHKPRRKKTRKRKYPMKIDDELKAEINKRVPEFFLNQNQSFLVCITDLLRSEGIE